MIPFSEEITESAEKSYMYIISNELDIFEDDYCAIIDDVGWNEMEHLENELHNDIEKNINDMRIKQDDFKRLLQ
ncbi:hypothetical protein [Bacillus thuringiensis]|uniref:hypothetical protein n=1 Tax=Bacillus thuringiensis TaxID=1428 RepID=UPI000941DD60|nr:hypothetical protein [Bacillus thuringiensis]MCU4885150.1 CbrC family protein [Bacillus cereus]